VRPMETMTTIETQSRGWEEVPGLLQSVWRYKWMIAAAVLVGGLLGYGWASRQPTVYQAASRVFLADPPSALNGAPAGEPDRYLRNQAELIGSSEVLRRAAELSGGKLSAGALAQRLNVDPSQDADVLTITMSDSTAEGAAELANVVGAAYERFAAEQSRATLERLRDTRSRLEARLAGIQSRLAESPNDGPLVRQREAVSQELSDIERQLLDMELLAGSNRILMRERAGVPEQPILPAPRRSMAIGMLFGLVGSGALAWWLGGRQSARAAHVPAARGWKLQEGNGSIDLPTPQNGSVRRLVPSDEAGGIAPSPSTPAPDPDLACSTLRDAVVRLDAALLDPPLEPVFEALPRLMVEEIISRMSMDLVVILLDDGKGSFEVAGGVGLRPEEYDMVVPHSHEALHQAVWDGLGIVVPNGNRSKMETADLPGGLTADALLMVPLVQSSTLLGMLLIGRRSGNGRPDATFNDEEIRQGLWFAGEFAPVVHVLSVADELRDSLQALGSVRDERDPHVS
jgi:capsular polysaccharide biosynthesis protein